MKWFNPEDWKRGVALVILWAYAYQLVFWPIGSWVMALLTLFTDKQWPSLFIVPWEQLAAGTATLATIGGIQTWREKKRDA